jgi:hypothetical protein
MDHEYKVKFGDQIKDLEGMVSDYKKQIKNKDTRLTRIF